MNHQSCLKSIRDIALKYSEGKKRERKITKFNSCFYFYKITF